MLEIEYFGGSCVKITSGKQSIVADPKRSVIGLKDIDTSGLVELATERRLACNNPKAFLRIEGPGEYEVADFSIRGFAANRMIDFDNERNSTVYVIQTGDAKVGLIGHISAEVSEEQLENLGVIDVLILPVGGGGTLDGKQAAELAKQIEPKVIIPVNFASAGLKYEVKQDGLSLFVDNFGVEAEKIEKYRLKKTDNLPDQLTIFELALKY